MKTFVLVAMMWTGPGFGNGQLVMQEFTTIENCEKAAAIIRSRSNGSRISVAVCTEK